MFGRTFKFFLLLVSSAALASATTPVVTVTSPAPGTSLGSPINYVASASSSACSKGISAMRIYTASGVNAYTISANSLNTNINLPPGSYSTVVQAWDNCGGVGKTTVNIKVTKNNLAPAKFLYGTEFKAGRIAEYVVDPLTGSIKPTSQGSIWAHWGPVDIASDHWGNHLFVANDGSHDLNSYVINRSSGNLTNAPGSPVPLTGPGLRVVVQPSGQFVYATSNNSSEVGEISAFAVQSNGSLKPVPGSPFAEPSATVGALAIHPSGKYLYAGVDGAGNVGAIAVYEINQTNGALTPVGSPFPVPTYPGCSSFCYPQPDDLQADPTGNYLYAAQGPQDAVAAFKIDQTTGTLTNLPGSPYPERTFNTDSTPEDPIRLGINPNGKFLYTADDEGDTLSVWTLNKSTGVPSWEASLQPCSDPNVPGILVPYTVAVDPSGSFVYTQGDQTNGCNTPAGSQPVMAGFSMNQGNGYLFSVPGNPFVNSNLHSTTISRESVVVTR
ncbi:MAG TPA: beta-propeller fold lactonase family protein [Terriglobales bacterium]|nr:beta-propeller fold lactonase family protein [Terriglobales bacterium]